MYMDADGSGGYVSGDVAHVDTGVNSLMSVTDWARNNGRKLYLGEFGAPDTVNGREAVRRTLEFLKRNRDVWTGWSWWCAAPWASYKLNMKLDASANFVAWCKNYV
jgi:endoglucanase